MAAGRRADVRDVGRACRKRFLAHRSDPMSAIASRGLPGSHVSGGRGMEGGTELEARRFFQLLEFVRKQLSEECILAVLRLCIQQLLKTTDILGRHPLGV